MTAAEIDSLIDGVASQIGTQEIRSFVDRRRADLHTMVAAAIASLEPREPLRRRLIPPLSHLNPLSSTFVTRSQ